MMWMNTNSGGKSVFLLYSGVIIHQYTHSGVKTVTTEQQQQQQQQQQQNQQKLCLDPFIRGSI